jgi:geranylgeranyl diphosphate synthase type II
LALNAGDAMAIEALALLRENRHILGTRMADRICSEFELSVRHTLEGQAIELGWRRDGVIDLDEGDYLDLIVRKTCWYTTIHPIRVGAMIGSWNGADLRALTRFGLFLGAAFQIQDDILNLVGSEVTYGKEILGDLFEGKRTLMLVHLMNAVDDCTRREIQEDFLAAPRSARTRAQATAVLNLMHRHGSIEYARSFAQGVRDQALHAFEPAFSAAPDSRHRRFLFEMIDFMLAREG